MGSVVRLPGEPGVRRGGKEIEGEGRMAGHRTQSDTLKLRRLISNLKDSGSELGSELEERAGTFFAGVQIVRTGERRRQIQDQFSSDEDAGEDESEFMVHADFLRRKNEEETQRKR